MTTIKRLQAIVAAFGVLLIIVRVTISDEHTSTFMSIVNSAALYVSIEILLASIDSYLQKFIKQKHENISYSYKRVRIYKCIRWGLTIGLIFLIPYVNVYNSSVIGNDIITIFTLALSLSTDFIAAMLSTLIYREI